MQTTMERVEDVASVFNSANTPPPPFLNKTYDMVDDPSTDTVVSWSKSNNSFVVWNVPEFSRDLLPKYFKHNNFSSFVRQLNTYGFRKVDPDRWEFANEGFLRGQKHLLKTVSRRKPAHVQNHQQQPPQVQSSQVGACVDVGNPGLEEEVESLKRDKNSLMQELVRLRQQQQATENQLHNVGQRMQGMEQRQQQMMSFLAKAMHNPGFLSQLVQHQNENNRLITGSNKKRRLPRQEDEILVGNLGSKVLDGQMVKYQPSMNEAAKAMLRQILKMNTSPKLEPSMINPDAFLIDNVPSNATDSMNTSSRILGVTLSEVPPISAECDMPDESIFPVSCHSTGISEVQSSPFAVSNSVKETQVFEENMLNFQQDPVIPELTRMQGIVPESNVEIPNANFINSETGNAGYMGMSAGLDGRLPTDIDPFSPEPDAETLPDGVSSLPSINDIFWEQFLTASPLPGDTDEISLSSDDGVTVNQDLQLGKENGWDKSQHMNYITEQMQLLASGSRIG
ncbi:heat stress transcription factor A-1b [Pyrus x bretschneideri]|uniref:heat stress transcription factor A-1b n=1 Tax=Pyrus x bretschneideri TaxID=225117 RepID=UPI00202E3D4D|nr:heat stress transcription factor A-1b [Pyrus x bretschneideri]